MTQAQSTQSTPRLSDLHDREEKALLSLPTAMGPGKPFPRQLPDLEAFVVDFERQSDPWMPCN